MAGVGMVVVVAATLAVHASASSGTVRPNPIVRENSLPGMTGWAPLQAPAGSIEGYASEVSALPGGQVQLHVATAPAARYRLKVFRLGWYGGTGRRLLECLPSCSGDEQGVVELTPAFDPTTGYLNAGWPVTDRIDVGRVWVSGYYVADLLLTNGPSAGMVRWVPFVVREPPSEHSAILVMAAVNTWQAYNRWGGMSLYKNPAGTNCAGTCTHVSFDRPYDVRTQNLGDYEVPLAHFLEEHGYDVSYTTDADVDRDPSELLRHRLVIVAGHNEYWTKTMRDAFDRARALGTNLAFLGADIGYWQIRYADDRRTIVEYRSPTLDPETDPALKTTRFRSLTPPQPECQLEGVEYAEGSGQAESIGGPFDYTVNPAALNDPWFTNTGFTASSILKGLVGYEWDQVIPGCQGIAPTVLFQYQGRPTAADAVRFTAASGARVFSAGTLNFTHGLNDYGTSPTGDPRLERFMQNALTDLLTPAPATSLQITRQNAHTVTIRVLRHPDPRITAALVYRERKLICTTTTFTCTDRHATRVQVYAAVLRDRWNQSDPVYSH
jgi:hypothetical protein